LIHLLQRPYFSYHSYSPHRDLHSFPTRRSSDLVFVMLTDGQFRPGFERVRINEYSAIHDVRLPEHAASHGQGRDDQQSNGYGLRSEEHTSELQSPCNLVCRLLLEKKKKVNIKRT